MAATRGHARFCVALLGLLGYTHTAALRDTYKASGPLLVVGSINVDTTVGARCPCVRAC